MVLPKQITKIKMNDFTHLTISKSYKPYPTFNEYLIILTSLKKQTKHV
ncbi:hypothetical protein PARC_a0810 [Pseudoalteromonas arctica A 37-1-2]|uniref:Uncharacterized protein n=1 Tax=Pseudoalteromonas arctica A 37-1-2 TaxID=1117313 RepID=A0A290S1V8_9GAMM|nr:hypothetical protein PARC_a0810 [Pseudoalteromonas arctica A 37-1-2]